MAKEPLILNLETSTEVCSVAVSRGGELLSLQTADQAYQHSEKLTLFIGECLREVRCSLREIDAVAVGSGPGSYTSLRVGTSTAKGICYALGLPLISVGTLQALALAAQNICRQTGAYYCPMIDARRMEVYCAFFDEENKPVTDSAAVVVEQSSFDDFFASGKTIVFTGNGAEKCERVLVRESAVFHPLACSASHMVSLAWTKFEAGGFEDIAYYVPTYLKPPNITKPQNMSMLQRLLK